MSICLFLNNDSSDTLISKRVSHGRFLDSQKLA